MGAHRRVGTCCRRPSGRLCRRRERGWPFGPADRRAVVPRRARPRLRIPAFRSRPGLGRCRGRRRRRQDCGGFDRRATRLMAVRRRESGRWRRLRTVLGEPGCRPTVGPRHRRDPPYGGARAARRGIPRRGRGSARDGRRRRQSRRGDRSGQRGRRALIVEAGGRRGEPVHRLQQQRRWRVGGRPRRRRSRRGGRRQCRRGRRVGSVRGIDFRSAAGGRSRWDVGRCSEARPRAVPGRLVQAGVGRDAPVQRVRRRRHRRGRPEGHAGGQPRLPRRKWLPARRRGSTPGRRRDHTRGISAVGGRRGRRGGLGHRSEPRILARGTVEVHRRTDRQTGNRRGRRRHRRRRGSQTPYSPPFSPTHPSTSAAPGTAPASFS